MNFRNNFSIVWLCIIVLFAFSSCKDKSESINADWESVPIRSKIEYEKGMPGGEGEQFLHSIVRSPSNPEVIYMSHDVSGSWKSTDNGNSWQKNIDKGLYLYCGQTIMVDPVNSEKLFIIVDERELQRGSAPDFCGLYKSEDGGKSWEFVLHAQTEHNRYLRNTIDYIPLKGKDQLQSPSTWFAGFSHNGLYRSDDGGQKDSWYKVAEIPYSVYEVKVDPQNYQVIYVATENGLYRSTDGGENLEPWILNGNKITSLVINSVNGKIFVAAEGEGLFVSENKKDFKKVNVILDVNGIKSDVSKKAMRITMNPGYPNQLFFIAINSQDEPATCVSNDGGQTWRHFEEAITFPGLERETGWRRWIDQRAGTVVPNPSDTTDAIAISRSTIFRLSIGPESVQPVESAYGFTGNAAHWSTKSIAFHPFEQEVFGIFCMDIGPRITLTNGDWFLEPYTEMTMVWRIKEKTVDWCCSFSGDFQPLSGSGVVVASIGWYNENAQLMRSNDFGKTWQLITSSPGDTESQKHGYAFVGFDPNKPENVYAGYQISRDAGKSFQPINFPLSYYLKPIEGSPNREKPFVIGTANHENKTYIFAIDRKYQHILRSVDECRTWIEIADLDDVRSKATFMDEIVTVVPHPTNPNLVFTLDKNHDLLKVEYHPEKDTTSYQSLNVFDYLPDDIPEKVVKDYNQIRTIALDPVNPDIIYVSMLAHGIPNIFGSKDGGRTWLNISEGLPCSGPVSIAVNPHTGELYRGSLVGTKRRRGLR
jgi:photosystem II stability/assembly factor-like uncharacterized protein